MRLNAAKLKALLRRYYFKMVGERGTPEYIARGWAIGVFVGWMAPVGFQMVAALPLSFWLRGSKIGAVAGTCITNPVTIIVLYPAQCYIGNLVTGGDRSYGELQAAIGQLREPTLEALMSLSTKLLADFFIGGAVFAAVTTPLTYYFVRAAVNAYRARRRKAQ